jgi:diguanylate cyclase (GGDEF)-like protein
MDNEIELLKRRLQREKNIRQQAEKIAEEKSRELYLKSLELENALNAELHAKKEIENLYHEVERLSQIDPLTGVDNRRSFGTNAKLLFMLAVRHQKKLSCAMLDIDFFKRVNDTYGHASGDTVLITVAKTCKEQIRETDLLARFGGEEFCFMFPETDIHSAALITERIRSTISKLEFIFEKKSFSVTVSIGLSQIMESGDDLEKMIKRSDDSLFKAKQNGRNRVVLWEG